MKVCPKCKQEYDALWRICENCNTLLADMDINSQSGKGKDILSEAKLEIFSIRKAIAKLNERLDILEYNLTFQETEYESIVQEEKEKIVVLEKEEPIFKEEIKEERKRDLIMFRKRWAEGFEQIVGGRLFDKLGILATVVGVALLIGYSFKYLGPIGKIAIGYVFSLGLLIFGSYIEKKENVSIYAKTLIAGGWAIMYFTTYAMHHIPVVQLIQSPILGILLLLGVSIATVLHIYKYKSEVATGFSYLLIFITLMLSPHLALYTMVAAAFVAISLIFFMYKEKWTKFGLYGMAMSYLTYTRLVISDQIVFSDIKQFFNVLMFLGLYWVIFVIATFIIREENNG